MQNIIANEDQLFDYAAMSLDDKIDTVKAFADELAVLVMNANDSVFEELARLICQEENYAQRMALESLFETCQCAVQYKITKGG